MQFLRNETGLEKLLLNPRASRRVAKLRLLTICIGLFGLLAFLSNKAIVAWLAGFNHESYLVRPRISFNTTFNRELFAGKVLPKNLSRVEFVLPPSVKGCCGCWGEDHPAFSRLLLSPSEITEFVSALKTNSVPIPMSEREIDGFSASFMDGGGYFLSYDQTGNAAIVIIASTGGKDHIQTSQGDMYARNPRIIAMAHSLRNKVTKPSDIAPLLSLATPEKVEREATEKLGLYYTKAKGFILSDPAIRSLTNSEITSAFLIDGWNSSYGKHMNWGRTSWRIQTKTSRIVLLVTCPLEGPCNAEGIQLGRDIPKSREMFHVRQGISSGYFEPK